MRGDIVLAKDIISMKHSSTCASQKQLAYDAVRESIYIMQSRCKLIPRSIFTFCGDLRGYRVVDVCVFVSDSLDILNQNAVSAVYRAHRAHCWKVNKGHPFLG